MTARLLIWLVVAFATLSANARSPWFAKGKYGISNVANQANNDQRTSDPNGLWIEIGENNVKIVDSPQLFTPEFGEGESLELTMKPVESSNTVIEYRILEFKSIDHGDGYTEDMCVLKNKEGEICNMRAGIIGQTKAGGKVYAFNIDDSQFKEIFWCFIDEDIIPYE